MFINISGITYLYKSKLANKKPRIHEAIRQSKKFLCPHLSSNNLQELAPSLFKKVGLPGFTGPFPPPLLIRFFI